MIYNKKKKKLHPIKIIIIAIVILIITILLIGASLNNDRSLNWFERSMKDSSMFIIQVVTSPLRLFNSHDRLMNNFEAYVNNPSYQRLKAENEQLKLDLALLRGERDINYAANYNQIIGTVITRNANAWFNTITIDVGANDGITEGLAVASNEGLVGITTHVSRNFTTVSLVSNNNTRSVFAASILTDEGAEFGFVRGYIPLENHLIFHKINHGISATVGDYVVTSPLNNNFPTGLKIGTISVIEQDEFGIVSRLHVEPNANLRNLTFVTVLVPR